MRGLANNKLTGVRIIGWGRITAVQRDYSTFIWSEGNSETDRSGTAAGRSLSVSDGKPARIGNEEEKQRRKQHPLAIRRSNKSNQLTHLPTRSTRASTNDS